MGGCTPTTIHVCVVLYTVYMCVYIYRCMYVCMYTVCVVLYVGTCTCVVVTGSDQYFTLVYILQEMGGQMMRVCSNNSSSLTFILNLHVCLVQEEILLIIPHLVVM